MHKLPILLKASWQDWLNSIQYASEERRKKVAEVIGFLVLMVALYLIGHAVFKVVGQQAALSPDAIGADTYTQTILIALNICVGLGALILAKGAIEGTIKQFYEAPDTSLLLSSLSPSTVFGFKLIQLIASNSLGMVMWLFPPWIAFGRLFGLPWHFYLGLIPTCFCLLVIVVTNVVVVMMLVTRFFSSQRMIQFLKVVGAIIGAAAGFFLAFSIFTFEWSDEIATFLLERLKLPTSDWFPHLWAAKLMMSWLPESGVQPLRWAIQLAVMSVATPFLSVLLASKIYHRCWEYARGVEINPKQNSKQRRNTPPLRSRQNPFNDGKRFPRFPPTQGASNPDYNPNSHPVDTDICPTLSDAHGRPNPLRLSSAKLSSNSCSDHDLQSDRDSRALVGRLQSRGKNVVAVKIKFNFIDAAFQEQTFDRDTLCSCLRGCMGFCNINPVSDTYPVMDANPIDDCSDHSDSHRIQHSNGDTTVGRRNWSNQPGFQQATNTPICDPSGHNYCQPHTAQCAHHNPTNRCP